MRHLFSLLIVFSFSQLALGQDTLPKFHVSNLGNDANGAARIVVSWVNNYDSLKQINIQSSHDSLKNYRTLVSIADPNAKMNGFADNKAINDHMFYRLFIVRKSGDYFFTKPQKPTIDTGKIIALIITDKKATEIKKPEAVIKKPDFVPSFYVYTNKEGSVFVNLPDAEKQKYRIKFYEEDESFLFEIKTIKKSSLTLDKTNFMRAGWYLFELYNDEKLVEKNKFYLAKEF
jgi:hypothetical protein